MKKVFFSALLMGFAAVSFAGTPKSETKGTPSPAVKTQDEATTYYAIKVDNPAPGQPKFRWTSDVSQISGLDCDPLPNAACEIQTTSTPVDGQVPTGSTVTGLAYQ